MKQTLEAIFYQLYGYEAPCRTFFSPGRVNLIGEHIDYNGGYVFPTALSIGNYGAIRLRNDQTIRLYSENFKAHGITEVSLSALTFQKQHGWANYVKGVIWEMITRGFPIDKGFDIAIYGDLPNSSGLSSSASIELLIAVMMNDVFQLNQSRPDLAVLCKKVENEYMGVNCGIMDQFVIANGKKDHALMLDCNTLEFTLVPLELDNYQIVICNSKVKRGLVDSSYNQRRSECEQSLSVFQTSLAITNLCEMTMEQFDRYKDDLKSDVLLRRSRHAVSEHQRVIQAVDALKHHDLHQFGQLMTDSHRSLRDDYEVSCKELDFLVEAALQNGAIGARMTGAGFGGCTVNLVKSSEVSNFTKKLLSAYEAHHHIQGEVYVAMPSDGTHEL